MPLLMSVVTFVGQEAELFCRTPSINVTKNIVQSFNKWGGKTPKFGILGF